jgi:hypothetical protein
VLSLPSGEPPAALAAPKIVVSELARLVGVAAVEVAGDSEESDARLVDRTGRDGVVGAEAATGRDFLEALRLKSVERAVDVALVALGEALMRALPGEGERPELGAL